MFIFQIVLFFFALSWQLWVMHTISCGEEKTSSYISDFIVNTVYVAGLYYTSKQIIKKKRTDDEDGAEAGFVSDLRWRVGLDSDRPLSSLQSSRWQSSSTTWALFLRSTTSRCTSSVWSRSIMRRTSKACSSFA